MPLPRAFEGALEADEPSNQGVVAAVRRARGFPGEQIVQPMLRRERTVRYIEPAPSESRRPNRDEQRGHGLHTGRQVPQPFFDELSAGQTVECSEHGSGPTNKRRRDAAGPRALAPTRNPPYYPLPTTHYSLYDSPYSSTSMTPGSSMSSLTLTRNCTASRPSTIR